MKIGQDYFFNKNKDDVELKRYQECLKSFETAFRKEIQLDTKTKIILDTNVLLRYYSISFSAREKLFSFLKKNKDRILIPWQVQKEFINNRESIISKYFDQVTSKIPKDFDQEIINKIYSFQSRHKIVLKDYPFVEEGLNRYLENLKEIKKELRKKVEVSQDKHSNLVLKDKFLDFLSQLTVLEALDPEEKQNLNKKFDELSKGISAENLDSILNRPNSAFPGLGDIKDKPKDPYGDFLIYHEIMRHMKNNQEDVIFLTFDTTKGDWMNKSKAPYLHYVLDLYENTNQLAFIIDADRALKNILEVSLDSLVKGNEEDEGEEGKITIENLHSLMESHEQIKSRNKVEILPGHIDELKLAGYNEMFFIEVDLALSTHMLKSVLEDKPYISRLGALRWALMLQNDDYKSIYNGEEKRMKPIGERVLRQLENYKKEEEE